MESDCETIGVTLSSDSEMESLWPNQTFVENFMRQIFDIHGGSALIVSQSGVDPYACEALDIAEYRCLHL